MFYNSQLDTQKEEYQKFLKIVGCLSNLFSDSDIPYLYYRIAEKIFCRAFNAEDLSRSDVSADAKKDLLGIGLKTFGVKNNRTFQKIAEFNRDRLEYTNLKNKKLIKKVSQLRNNRLDFTKNVYGLENSIYHCVLRESGKFKIFEEPMDLIDIQSITDVKKKKNIITFNDCINEYSFSLSKSTLSKRFITDSIIYEFDVSTLEDPLLELERLMDQNGLFFGTQQIILQTIYLPLYGRNLTVFEKSGLNQWNAGGRNRHPDEVYIPIPSEIHHEFPNYFPDRNTVFELKFPDGEIIESKICQSNGKALMTNPNRKLGKLILRDGLKLRVGELATYEKLVLFGIDSVRLDKISSTLFEINFAKVGSYENFRNIFK